MSTAVKRRRGTAAETAAFTGLEGEITVDTTDNRLVLHDGVTAGGIPMAREDEIPAGGGDALTANPLSQFAATTSAQLAGVLSDETGSGAAVFATSPTLVTPALGTPASGVLTNCTGLPTAGLVDDAVTYAKMQNVSATDMLLGRSTAGAGNVEEIPCTAAGRALLDDANAAAQLATLGLTQTYISMTIPLISASLTLGTVAAAIDFLNKSSGYIGQADLTGWEDARLICRVTTGDAIGSDILLRYYTAFSTTVGDYLAIGTSEVRIDMTTNGLKVSSWIPLATGAKADVVIAPCQIDGNGAGSPVIRWLWMEVRRRVYQ